MITGAVTSIGTVRTSNQDAVGMIEARKGKIIVTMLLVCDGMGGLSKGELASTAVARGMVEWFSEELLQIIELCSMEELRKLWLEKLERLSRQLKVYGSDRGILLGTTFSGILCCGRNYIWVHIGDSRIYKISPERVMCITTDHTMAKRQLELGKISKEEAMHGPLRNKLTQCVGASQTFLPDSGLGMFAQNESFLLCSDGFYHKFSEEEMLTLNDRKYDTEKTLQEFCEQAVKKVMERGERDNISVAVLKCRRGEE